MGNKYAEGTEVSEGNSKNEIERTLSRYGCDQFLCGNDAKGAMVYFRMQGFYYRFTLPYPKPDDVAKTPTGRTRMKVSIIQEQLDGERRRRWRALALLVKALLEATTTGIVTVKEVLLPFAVLPDNTTVAESAIPALEKAYKDGGAPKNLLPMFGSK